MRRVTLSRPFTKGMITDAPAHELGPQNSPYAQDGYSPQGVFKQRGGWAYDGTTAEAGTEPITTLGRIKFTLSATTRTITANANIGIYIHNASSAGTLINAGTSYLYRCTYNDQAILCATDGVSPILRYSGSGADTADSVLCTSVASRSVFNRSAGVDTFGATSTVGMYIPILATTGITNRNPYVFTRMVEKNSTTSITAENIRTAAAFTFTVELIACAFTFPCVNVYDEGTVSYSAGADTVTGVGTKWSFLANTDHRGTAIQALPTTGNSEVHAISYVSDTVLDVVNDKTHTDIKYAILRSCPFIDAAAHKGSFWGTGVSQYPSRVYISPVGWDMNGPPGFVAPLDPSVHFTSSNANDFLLDFVDVPSPFEGDPNIAILTSPNPLIVLKRNAVYGIYGSYPSFSVDLIADGIGCIDIRSAWSYDEGQFWCGETGIYWYTGGRIIDLTQGRINREWRSLTRDFDYGTSDYCTLAVSQGHLIVHITTAGGTIQRTFMCDLRDQTWQSRISNFAPRAMFTSRIPGEQEKLLSGSDTYVGRVIDFAPALNGEGTAEDDGGSGPRLEAWTPEGIDGSDIDDDTRFIDLSINANVYDAGSAAATTASVTVVTQNALTEDAPANLTLTALNSDSTDRIDRYYERSVNQRGRRHQVRLAVTAVGADTAATKVEIHQIDGTFRPTRGRT